MDGITYQGEGRASLINWFALQAFDEPVLSAAAAQGEMRARCYHGAQLAAAAPRDTFTSSRRKEVEGEVVVSTPYPAPHPPSPCSGTLLVGTPTQHGDKSLMTTLHVTPPLAVKTPL